MLMIIMFRINLVTVSINYNLRKRQRRSSWLWVGSENLEISQENIFYIALLVFRKAFLIDINHTFIFLINAAK